MRRVASTPSPLPIIKARLPKLDMLKAAYVRAQEMPKESRFSSG